MKNNEVKNENKKDTNLKSYFENHIEDIAKTLIELFEFQENIKFINTKIEYLK